MITDVSRPFIFIFLRSIYEFKRKQQIDLTNVIVGREKKGPGESNI